MAKETITVKLFDDKKVELASDSPDLKNLIQTIVENRALVNPESISVKCDDESFDCKGFADIVSAATKSFLEELRIDEENLKTALAEIDEEAR